MSCPFCSTAFWVKLDTVRWTSLGGFGDRFVEKARCLPLVGSRGDTRSFVQMAHMVHALMSDAPMSIDHGGAMLDTSHGTGHEMRRAGGITWRD